MARIASDSAPTHEPLNLYGPNHIGHCGISTALFNCSWNGPDRLAVRRSLSARRPPPAAASRHSSMANSASYPVRPLPTPPGPQLNFIRLSNLHWLA